MKRSLQKIAGKRAESIVNSATPLLERLPPGRILDFGSGIGWLGGLVASRGGHDLYALDIKRYPLTDPSVKIHIYGGEEIPFADGYFDAAFAAFSLHHTKDALPALLEIKRVTKGKIIVLEDHLPSRRWIMWEALKDLIANCFMDRITFEYRTDQEWKTLFEEVGLKIEQEIRFSSGNLLRFRHVGWLLAEKDLNDLIVGAC